MELLNSLVGQINDILWSYVLIILLIGAGIIFTIRTKFVQIRFIKEMIRLIAGDAGNKMEGQQISSFQAFCVSTASRVGVGNIAGIAIAVVLGGPGAIFWMWIIAILGSATGFVESTLAQIYKVPRTDSNGYLGGPAYYINNALHSPKTAVFFAILISITYGLIFNSVQSNMLDHNQNCIFIHSSRTDSVLCSLVAGISWFFLVSISLSLQTAFNFDATMIGIVIAVFSGIVVFGGLHRIAKVTEYMVPIMAGIYLLIAFAITIYNISELPTVLSVIFKDAWGIESVAGGSFGAAIMTGIKRGLFSNEAGMGSVPNAAATAEVSHPVKQGLIQAFGVFVDTLFICTASAFIVLFSSDYQATGLTGIQLIQYEINIKHLSDNPLYLNIFRILVVIMVFFGSVAELSLVWNLADLFMALMAITNIIAILLLGKYAFIALDDYTQQKNKVLKILYLKLVSYQNKTVFIGGKMTINNY